MKNMRSFIEVLRRSHPEQVVEVSEAVNPEYEVTAIQRELHRSGANPVLIFKKIVGSDLPLVTNLYGNRSRLAFALDTEPQQLSFEYAQRVKIPIAPVYTDAAPVQDVRHIHEAASFFSLPVIKAHEADAAPYVTGGVAIVRDPVSGSRNASFNRLMVVSADTAYTHLGPGRHLTHFFTQAEEQGKSLPVTFSIGTHPAWALGALSLISLKDDELDIMGGMAGEPVRLARALTVEGDCLADAEIVLEGFLVPGERMDEGPYCEFTGYATGMRKRQVFKLTAITMRSNALYHHISAGMPEHLLIGAVPREAKLFERALEVVPSIKQVHFPESGCGRFHCYVALEKKFPGQPKNVAMSLFGADLYLKLVVIVDEDIDVYDEKQVLWAIATRVQAKRDVCIIPDALGSDLDPSTEVDGVCSKMIIDATAKPTLRAFSVRADVPARAYTDIKRLDIFRRKGGDAVNNG